MTKYVIQLESKDKRSTTMTLDVNSRKEARDVLEVAIVLPEMMGGEGIILEDGFEAYRWDSKTKEVVEMTTYQIKKYHPDQTVGYIHLPKDASKEDALVAAKERAIDGCRTVLFAIQGLNDQGTIVAEFDGGEINAATTDTVSSTFSLAVDYHEGRLDTENLPLPFKFALPAAIKDLKMAMAFAESRANNDKKPVKVTLFSNDNPLCIFRGTGRQIVVASQTASLSSARTDTGSIIKTVGKEPTQDEAGRPTYGGTLHYPESSVATVKPGTRQDFHLLFQHVAARGVTQLIQSSFVRKNLEDTLKTLNVEGTTCWIQTTQVAVPKPKEVKPIKYTTPQPGPRVVQRVAEVKTE